MARESAKTRKAREVNEAVAVAVANIQPTIQEEATTMEANTNIAEAIEEAVQATVRANRIAIKSTLEGILEATFHRTHKTLKTVSQPETGFIPNEKANALANRELFRVYMIDNAQAFGINYDPADHRPEAVVLAPAKIATVAHLEQHLHILMDSNLETWVGKIGHNLSVEHIEAVITEVTKSPKGKDVKARYNDGSIAWASIQIGITVMLEGTSAVVTTSTDIVSGQLKKPALTYTAFKGLVEEQFPSIKPVAKDTTPAEAQANAEASAE